MRLKTIISFVLLVLTTSLVFGQADPATVAKIVDEGKNRNKVMEHMTYLTRKIGPRLTSSPQLDKAYQWAMGQFKKFGCKNVHLEQWGEFPVGFERGKRQVGRMVSPDRVDFQFTTPSWSYGTKGSVSGPAVAAPATMEEFEKVKDRLKNAWVIVKGGGGRGGFRGPGGPSELDKAIDGAGINGRVSSSGSDLVITSGRHNVKLEEIPTTVRVTIRKQDMDAVQKAFDDGKEPILEFDIENKLLKGPRTCSNVIAEIPGTEKPEEVVIVSGHLDSWDGPGSEGAQDNGTGTMVALEAARILCKVGAKPKRTIRFIMWSGEEEGLLGSLAYVKAHKDEMDKISCVFVDDGGTNYEGGLTCTEDMKPMLEEALAPAMKAFPDMPIEIRSSTRIPRGGGSDHASFNQVGVPGFFWFEKGKGDYRHVHHTQYDRLDTVIPEYLVQSSTNSAAASYIVACAPTLLPREKPATPAPTPPTGPP